PSPSCLAPCTGLSSCWSIVDIKHFPGYQLLAQAVQPPAAPAAFQAFTPNMPGGWASPSQALGPPAADSYPTNTSAPYPLLVDTSPGVGTYSANYRSEPVPLRVQPGTNSGNTTDLSWAFASLSNRNISQLNTQPENCPTKPN